MLLNRKRYDSLVEELLSGIMKFTPLIGSIAVPLVGLVIKLRNDRQDPAAVRSIKQHAKLHDVLPEDSRSSIKELLDFETAQYAAKVRRRKGRTLNGGNVAAFVVIALVTGGLLYGAIAWALMWPWAWIVAGVVALAGVVFLSVGAGQLFKYEEVSNPESATKSGSVDEAQDTATEPATRTSGA